jgi:hypothetical protein
MHSSSVYIWSTFSRCAIQFARNGLRDSPIFRHVCADQAGTVHDSAGVFDDSPAAKMLCFIRSYRMDAHMCACDRLCGVADRQGKLGS